MKILMLNPNQIHRYNWGHQLFRNEFSRQAQVVYWGKGFPNFNEKLDIKSVIKHHCPWTPDAIFTYGWRYSVGYEGLGDIKNIAKVHITVDYARPAGFPKQNAFFKKNNYDLVFAITQNAYNLQSENKVCDKIRILPFSADTNIYKSSKVKKENRVLAAFTTRKDVYPNRIRVQKTIKSLGVKVTTKRLTHQRLINAINRCKITVTSNNIFKSLSMRYTETLACGGFLLADEPEDLAMVGLKDGEHLVIYKDIEDLKKKVLYYLNPKHEAERKIISNTGMKFVRKNHSCKKRATEALKIINEELGIQ